jgi:hypothetical protein
MNKNKILWIGLSLLAMIIIIIPKTQAEANVTIFAPSVVLGGGLTTATSTLTQIGPGTGTSTLVYDAYNTGQPFAASGAVMFIIDTASSTASVLKVTSQYSQNGVDWYADTLNFPSTTTPPFNLNAAYSWQYTAPSTGSTTNVVFSFLTPVRYAKFTFTGTGATSSIYAQVTPRRELVQ